MLCIEAEVGGMGRALRYRAPLKAAFPPHESALSPLRAICAGFLSLEGVWLTRSPASYPTLTQSSAQWSTPAVPASEAEVGISRL